MKRMSGFSLAEMMVLLLVLAICAAASAPMITKKLHGIAGNNPPWVVSDADQNIVYNTKGANISAVIGTTKAPRTNGKKARMHIQSLGLPNFIPHISFGTTEGSATTTTNLLADTTSLFFTDSTINKSSHTSVMSIGPSSSVSTSNSVAIGPSTSADEQSLALGVDAIASDEQTSVVGTGSEGIGASVVLGHNALSQCAGMIVIGTGSNPAEEDLFTKDNSIAVGAGTITRENSIAIGRNTMALARNAIVIGQRIGDSEDSGAFGENSIALGDGAVAWGDNSVAIGAKRVITRTQESTSGSIDGFQENYHETTVTETYPALARANSMVLGYETLDTNLPSPTIHIPGNLIVAGHVALGAGFGSAATGYITPTVYLNIHSKEANLPEYYRTLRMLEASNVRSNIQGSEGHFFNTSIERLGNEPDLNGAWAKGIVPSGWALRDGWYSDRRLKSIGEAFKAGFDEIKKLEVFHYTFKKDPNQTPRVGVMAQDLQKIFPAAVHEGRDGFLRIRMEDMFYAVVNAIKELETMLTEQKVRMDTIAKNNKVSYKRLAKIEKRIAKLEKKEIKANKKRLTNEDK